MAAGGWLMVTVGPVQPRHEVPTEVDLAATSFKAAVALTPGDALPITVLPEHFRLHLRGKHIRQRVHNGRFFAVSPLRTGGYPKSKRGVCLRRMQNAECRRRRRLRKSSNPTE